MKYEHPAIVVNEVAPGHFVISNILPCRVDTENGTIVAPNSCYISPAIPTELLEAIVAERMVAKDSAPAEPTEGESQEGESQEGEVAPKKRARKAKAEPEGESQEGAE